MGPDHLKSVLPPATLLETAQGLEPTRGHERRLLRWGLLLLGVILGGFLLWAALAPLSSAAIGHGVVIVDGHRKTVQHLEGGIVRTLPVKEGDRVARDQVLLTLDDTQSRAQLELLRGQLWIQLAKEARLVAQRDRLPQIAYPAELLAARQDPRVEDTIRLQNQTFRAREVGRQGESALIARQIQQLRARAQGILAQRVSRDSLARSYQGELEDFNALLKDGYADRQRVRDAERALEQNASQRAELSATLASTEGQISELQLRQLQLDKELQREVAQELAGVQSELSDLRSKLQALNDTVSRTTVRAPEAGVAIDVAVHTVGAVVKPGEKLLDIVPQDERLVIEAQLSPQDIDQLRVGQSAQVRFSGFKQRDTTRIEGRLVTLSADRLVEEQGGQRVPFYRARVELTKAGLAELHKAQLKLVPGMPAEVMIETGERTVLSYLFGPVRDSLARSFRER